MFSGKLAAILGTAFAGVATGCLTFVSFVDVRSFLTHVEEDRTKMIQDHFPVWWPYGRDLMVPVLLAGTISNLTAYYQTKDIKFAITSGLICFVGPYTGIVLGEDIETLRKSDPADVAETTRRFCNLHHVRLVVAATGFGFALTALADL
ncbi:unnamed protein product [Cylindrotheca closterium]|uniref:DUF1772 domain-containing protein n=1 Tax=Cylindrotheca closterium TaxID=2856 RepID=A0AAD2G484_9STRA|nr:unnamed protein product [Cylindrotheca closterium]